MNNKIYLPDCGIYTSLMSSFINKITNLPVISESNANNSINKNIPMTINIKISLIIKALNKGSNYLIDLETGDITKYYGIIMREVLENLGYNFQFIKIISRNHLSLKKTYSFAKSINNKINYYQFFIKYIRLLEGIYIIDKYENFIKEEKIELLNDINLIKLIKINNYYKKHKKKYPTSKYQELIYIDESNVTNNLYQKLKLNRIRIHKVNNFKDMFLPFSIKKKPFLSKSYKYLKYSVGSNSRNIIIEVLKYIKAGSAGIIYLHNKECLESINLYPIIESIAKDNHILALILEYNDPNIDTKVANFITNIEKNKTK